MIRLECLIRLRVKLALLKNTNRLDPVDSRSCVHPVSSSKGCEFDFSLTRIVFSETTNLCTLHMNFSEFIGL